MSNICEINAHFVAIISLSTFELQLEKLSHFLDFCPQWIKSVAIDPMASKSKFIIDHVFSITF